MYMYIHAAVAYAVMITCKVFYNGLYHINMNCQCILVVAKIIKCCYCIHMDAAYSIVMYSYYNGVLIIIQVSTSH